MGSMPLWMWIAIVASIALVAASIIYAGKSEVQRKIEKLKDN